MAATHALICGWNRGVAGREPANLELFQRFLAHLAAAAGAGKIDSFEPVILAPHGGDLNGFILIRGSADQLHQLRQTDDWKDMEMRALVGIEGYGVNEGFLGAELEARMAHYGKIVSGG